MIRNYNELAICIAKIEKQMPKLIIERRNQIYNLDFKKAETTLSKQQLIELQILNYIGYYQEKIKNQYLEEKLYYSKLSVLKIKYQTKNIINDVMHCLEQLIMQYNELENDLWIFSKLNTDYCPTIEEKMKKIILRMERIYFQLEDMLIISDAKINMQQTAHYNLIIRFFNNYYTSQIESLEEKLNCKNSALDFIESLKKLINPATSKMIQLELETKKEKEEITEQIDYLITAKKRYNQLSENGPNRF